MDIRAFFLTLVVVPLAACSGSYQPVTGTAGAPGSRRADQGAAACVDFNQPGLGTEFGGAASSPSGSLAWTENAIPVSVEEFEQGAGSTAYNVLRTEIPPAGFGLSDGTTARANSIGARFDFTGLPFAARTVRFHFLHRGGTENLRVNGSRAFVGPLTAAPASLGGLTVAAASSPVAGGSQGTITVSGGVIGAVVVGGEELWLDSVCAYA
ncbi:MAG TPA: hypothetical protein VEX86_26340 [Longimicrobium sp.]|nr:hypothetical protein [Longimicrobium sp.]